MSDRYPGGIITKTPVTPAGPYQEGAAPGIWTLEQQAYWQQQGLWPVAGNATPNDPYFQYVTSLLHGDGTNGGQNNTFLDSSSNAFSITRNGNTTQGSFSPYGDNWGNYFAGDGSKLNFGTTSSFNWLHNTSALFTMEAWVYINSYSLYGNVIFSNNDSGSANIGANFQINDNGTIGLYITRGVSGVSNTVSGAAASTGTISLNTWTHVAVTWDYSLASDNAKFYINGQASGATTKINTASNSNASYAACVGAPNTYAGQYMNGYISNFRISNSIVYSSSFTPSTTPLTTSSQGATSVAVLTCQSNRFIDNSSNAYAITLSATPQVTRFSPFAPTISTQYSASTIGGSGYFDGSGDYLQTPTSSSLTLAGTSDWQVDFWYYPTATPAQYSGPFGGSGTNGIFFCYRSGNLDFTNNNDNAGLISSPFPKLNAWSHLVLVNNGTTNQRSVFINGVRTGTYTSNFTFTNDSIILMQYPASTAKGYLANFRIQNGARDYDPASSTITVPTSPTTNTASTVLLCNFTNGTIYDSAEVGDYETVGNAQVSTSVKKYGTGSMSFDGTGDWLISSNTQDFNFGTGNFTIEYWIYLNSTSGNPTPIDHGYTGSGISANGYVLQYSSGQLKFYSNSTSITSSVTDSTSTWYHYAISRVGSTVKIFRNGTQVASGTFSNSMTYDATLGVGSNIRAGSGFAVGAGAMNGYMDDLRITKGYARYWENFTPPATALPNFSNPSYVPTQDPQFNYTTLLLPGNGTNGAQNNTFLDSSTNAFTITRNGNTTQGTFTPFSQTGWGNYFDGSGDYLATPSNAAFAFGTGDYTIETWVYPQQFANQQIFNFSDDADNLSLDPAGTLTFYDGSIYTTGATYVLNQWQHIAYTRSSGTVRIFLNGTLVKSFSSSYNSGTRTAYFGARGIPTAGANCLLGYMSNIRIVKGTAVYTANFTPSTTPLTAVSGTSVLTAQSNRFIDNSTNAFAITVNGNPQVQAFSPFAPTAAYSTSTVGGSGYFDGSGDYLTTSSSQVIPTGSFTIEAWVYTTNANSTNKYIVAQGSSGDSGRTGLGIESSAWWFQIGGDYVNAGTPVLGQWNYVAMTFNGSTIQGYVNGVSQGSISHSGNAQNTTLSVGTNWNSAVWNGYISSVRISNTVRTVTSIPTAPFSNDANTTFLANFTNAGITDATAKNDLETVGNAQISTTQSKFGGSSMYFDGTNSYMTMPNSKGLQLGIGDFTIEGWLYLNVINTGMPIVSQFNSNGGNPGWTLYIKSNNVLEFYAANGAASVTGTTALAASTWYHFAVVKYGSTITIYVNGAAGGSGSNTSFTDETSQSAYIGGRADNASYLLNGYIDDLRITKGYARYVQPFTPPAQADQLY